MNRKIKIFINENLIKEYSGRMDFAEWFSGSKVIDNSGKPLLLYHGGPKFDKFRVNETGDYGIYFTDNYHFSLMFAIEYEFYQRDKKDDWDDIPDSEHERWENEGEFNTKYLKYSEVKSVYLRMINPIIMDSLDAKLIPNLYDNEHDGVIVKSTGDHGYKGGQYVVFSDEQVWLLR